MKWGVLVAAVLIGFVIYLLDGKEAPASKKTGKSSETQGRQFPLPESDEKANDPFTKPETEGSDEESAPQGFEAEKPEEGLAKLDQEEVRNDIPLTEEEMEELEEYFEKIEEEWGKTLENLFKVELALPKETIEKYEDLREGFEEEKLAAFQEYHEQMVAKHGDNYAYRPSEDEKIFEKKVLDEYYDRLRKVLGDDAYSRYTEVRERYNERIKAEQDPRKGILIIDF